MRDILFWTTEAGAAIFWATLAVAAVRGIIRAFTRKRGDGVEV